MARSLAGLQPKRPSRHQSVSRRPLWVFVCVRDSTPAPIGSSSAFVAVARTMLGAETSNSAVRANRALLATVFPAEGRDAVAVG